MQLSMDLTHTSNITGSVISMVIPYVSNIFFIFFIFNFSLVLLNLCGVTSVACGWCNILMFLLGHLFGPPFLSFLFEH